MGLLDILLGRSRPTKSRTDRLLAITTAQITLSTRFNTNPAGKAAVCFRSVSSSYYDNMESELRQLLHLSARTTHTQVKLTRDQYGFDWVVLHDPDFEDLVSMIHLVGQTLADHGLKDQLLAAVFAFRHLEREIYWVYNYKRARFYPFVPTGDQARDNALELRMGAVMEKELPVEDKTEYWYALWGIPF